MKMCFYRCNICGKIIAVLSRAEVPTVCCGQPMEELIPNKTDGAFEKHVPVFSVSDNTVTVKVGSSAHPMTDSHSIMWICLCTAHGFSFKELHPGDNPEAVFSVDPSEHAETVFAYCNLHGLWCSESEQK